ncbi:MAG: AraC family transcriptional regulator [Moraxella sp.]|nr:AraC family transcriptional regulator [Moraxella sp.]
MQTLAKLIQRYAHLSDTDKQQLLHGLAFGYSESAQTQQTPQKPIPAIQPIQLSGGICYPANNNNDSENNGENNSILTCALLFSGGTIYGKTACCKVSFHLDSSELKQLISEYANSPAMPAFNGIDNIEKIENKGNGTHAAVTELINAFSRLLVLNEQPESIPVIAPLIRREIHYWLLRSPLGSMICQTLLNKRHKHRIQRAIDWLQQHFDSRLSVKALAASVQMSQSNFHICFRRVTNNTPLQFQKQLRLQKARQLMLGGEDAASAAFAVGYESTSQFSREYHRYFGNPPVKDVRRLGGYI